LPEEQDLVRGQLGAARWRSRRRAERNRWPDRAGL